MASAIRVFYAPHSMLIGASKGSAGAQPETKGLLGLEIVTVACSSTCFHRPIGYQLQTWPAQPRMGKKR